MLKSAIPYGVASATISIILAFVFIFAGAALHISRLKTSSMQGGGSGATINAPTLFGKMDPYPILINGTARGTNRIIIGLVSNKYVGQEDYDSLRSFDSNFSNIQQLDNAFLTSPINVIRSHWDLIIDPSTRWYHGVYRILLFDTQTHTLLAESAETTFPPPVPAVFPSNAYDSPQ